jgi:pSer/pThr/pTyr-binding forkhead associated (FHA) protein
LQQDTSKKYTIGRDRTCNFPVSHDSVSRVHAEITILDGGRYEVADRKSRNGTRLVREGRTYQLQREYVLPTDEIQFGEATIPVLDILTSLGIKPAATAPSGLPRARPRLSRCACGFVKPHQEVCPECGL